jgi:hypothetical protein
MITVTSQGAKEVKANIPYRVTQSVGFQTFSCAFKFYTRRTRKDGMVTLFGKSCSFRKAIIFPRIYVWNTEELGKRIRKP